MWEGFLSRARHQISQRGTISSEVRKGEHRSLTDTSKLVETPAELRLRHGVGSYLILQDATSQGCLLGGCLAFPGTTTGLRLSAVWFRALGLVLSYPVFHPLHMCSNAFLSLWGFLLGMTLLSICAEVGWDEVTCQLFLSDATLSMLSG